MNFNFKRKKKAPKEDKALFGGDGGVYTNPTGDVSPINRQNCLEENRAFIYICTKLVSQNCAAVPLRLYASSKKNEKDISNFETKEIGASTLTYLKKSKVSQLRSSERVVEILDHPALDLLYYVNPDSNFNDNFELTYQYLDLCGNSYWYVEKDSRGIPTQLQQLRPDRIKVVPDSSTGMIRGYLYGSKALAFSRDEVVRFNVSNPLNKWYGSSIIEAMSAAVKRNNQADAYEAGRLQNYGRPDFVVQYKQPLEIEQMRKLDLAWNKAMRGPENASRVKIMGSDFEIKTLSMTPQEMEYLAGRVMTQKELCAAFGIPYSMIDSVDQKRAGLDQTEKLFQKNAVAPRLKNVETALNDQLLKIYDPSGSLFFAFDDPIAEDKEFNLKLEESRLSSGVYTVDEIRQREGLDAR